MFKERVDGIIQLDTLAQNPLVERWFKELGVVAGIAGTLAERGAKAITK